MLFGRRKPGYTTTVDAASDPEQVILDLQKAEMAAKKKPKAEVFDIDAASETARRLKETGSMFDGSAAKLGEDVIAAVQKETDALAAKQAEAQPALEETAAPDAAEKPQLLDFLAAAPEAEGDPYADQPTVTAPELPELTPAQELAGYIRSRSAAALVTPHALLVVGFVVQVALQAVLNMAVVTNTIPNTGISLPFFSSGGTSLMMLLGEMGIVLSVSRGEM